MQHNKSGSLAMPVRLHHSQDGFHKRHPSWGKSKVYHKIQSDMCPPLQAKGAKCPLALKREHLFRRGRDMDTPVKLLHTSKTGEYKTDLKCPLKQHNPINC